MRLKHDSIFTDFLRYILNIYICGHTYMNTHDWVEFCIKKLNRLNIFTTWFFHLTVLKISLQELCNMNQGSYKLQLCLFTILTVMLHVTIWWGQKLGLHTCYNRFNGRKSWAVCCIYLMIKFKFKFDYNSAQLSTNSGRMTTVCWQDSREGGNKLKSNTRGSFWSQRSMETYLYMSNIFLFDLLYWLSSAWWDTVSSVGYDDTTPNHIYVHVFVSAC